MIKRDGFELVHSQRIDAGLTGNSQEYMVRSGALLVSDGPYFHVYIPKKSEWNGEGLPPVGIDCEYRVGNGPWFKCNIRYITTPYHDNPVEVVMFPPHLKGEQVGVVGNDSGEISFRPIRTPEQTKAEERQKAIAEMAEHMAGYKNVEDPNEKMLSLSTYLHDHGYRLQVVP